jgi:protein-S-isoprenylcysteine O-methyltransferase Ste14
LQALPALAVPIWAEAASSPLAGWPLYAELAFAVGGALTAVALLALGRSFAILPAVRRIVTTGPYRIVRHPAYAGELIMVASCVLARPSWPTAATLVVGMPLVGLRIAAEERLLRSEAGYDEYAHRVRWRLLPLVW